MHSPISSGFTPTCFALSDLNARACSKATGSLNSFDGDSGLVSDDIFWGVGSTCRLSKEGNVVGVCICGGGFSGSTPGGAKLTICSQTNLLVDMMLNIRLKFLNM